MFISVQLFNFIYFVLIVFFVLYSCICVYLTIFLFLVNFYIDCFVSELSHSFTGINLSGNVIAFTHKKGG